jgi:hypothetical protein
MNTSDILTAFQALGLSVDIADDRLRVRPRDLLTPAIRTLIANHRADLIDAISTGPPEEAALDPEIVASVGLIWNPDTGRLRRLSIAEMRSHLANCLEYFVDTENEMWAEAAGYWSQAILLVDHNELEQAA